METNENTEQTIQALRDELEKKKSWNKWFFGRVKWMRECQQCYFSAQKQWKAEKKGRARKDILDMNEKDMNEWLVKSRAAEAEVDKEIGRISMGLLKKSEPVQMLIETFGCEDVGQETAYS